MYLMQSCQTFPYSGFGTTLFCILIERNPGIIQRLKKIRLDPIQGKVCTRCGHLTFFRRFLE